MTTSRADWESQAEVWRRYDADEARLTAHVSRRMLELAQLQSGQRVLDLATGRGEPALQAAQRVGPDGRVVGLDVAQTMLQMTQQKAKSLQLANLRLLCRSAEQLEQVVTGPFDAVLCRWGLMYFEEPAAALAATRRVIAARGRLVVAVWAEPERVDYRTLPPQAWRDVRIRAGAPLAAEPADATFRYSDMEQLEHDLAEAGFRVQSVEEVDTSVMEATNEQDLIHWARTFGMNRALAGAASELQRAWEAEFVTRVARTPDGCFRLGGVTRVISATPR